jgi:hypothetical protein
VVQFTRPRVVHIGRPWVVHTARPRPVQTTRPSLVQYSPAGDNYPLSYSMNSAVACRNADALKVRRTKCMLLIQERRAGVEAGQYINDGIFNPDPSSPADLPSKVHYGGTCVLYLAGNASYREYKQLIAEMCKEDAWRPR